MLSLFSAFRANADQLAAREDGHLPVHARLLQVGYSAAVDLLVENGVLDLGDLGEVH